MMKLAVVIPAYNEEKTIAKVINGIPTSIDGVKDISVVVVSDNSSDHTIEEARRAGAIVLNHRMNLGAGGATMTGLEYAKKIGADIVVTLDGDGQHDPKEISKLVNEYRKNNSQLIIGSRFLSDTINRMPRIKNIGNRVMNFITYIFSGKLVTDSQSGFRLFGDKIINNSYSFITTNGYEFCSEAIISAKRLGYHISEVPIATIYHKGRKGQNPLNGINILIKLFYKSVAG